MDFDVICTGIILPLIFVKVVSGVDCIKDCKNPDFTDQNYRPQKCQEECSEVLNNLEEDDDDDNYDLETKIDRLFTLVIVLTILVILMILIFIFVIVKNSKLSSVIWKSWKKTKHHTNVKITAEKDVSRIANYSQNPSNASRIVEATSMQIQCQAGSHANQLPAENKIRSRKPSESTCPEESESVDTVGAYDNLALSTSTLNGPSRPSSRASQSTSSPVSNVAPSMAALNTTMTTIQMDSLPQRSDAARRTTP